MKRKKDRHGVLKLDSSNLFTQLYHKVRFVEGLRAGGIACLELGLDFPNCSTISNRKLGNNPIVHKATSIIENYIEDAFYIALVPDTMANLEEFYQKELPVGPESDVTEWNTDGWGYLAWERVEEFCRVQNLESTLHVFEFNKGQIY